MDRCGVAIHTLKSRMSLLLAGVDILCVLLGGLRLCSGGGTS